MGLFTNASVAIDGSKFKAVNNRDKNFTHAKMKRRLEQIEESIGRNLHQMDSADRRPRETTSLRGYAGENRQDHAGQPLGAGKPPKSPKRWRPQRSRRMPIPSRSPKRFHTAKTRCRLPTH
jgi:hypothetical protein